MTDKLTQAKALRINELQRISEDARKGFILGVRIAKPRPWEPAAQMLELQRQGKDIKTIASLTGYSIPTVKRNLETQGIDHRTGPQCNRHTGRTFTVDEALREMPIPCGESCACWWRPVLKSDAL